MIRNRYHTSTLCPDVQTYVIWKNIQHVNVLYVTWIHLYVIQIRKSKHTYVVHWIQNLIWHLVDACGRTKWSSSTWHTQLSNSTLSWRKDSPSVWLTRKTKGANAARGTRCVRRNEKRWWPQRGRLSRDSRRRRECASKTAPSKTGYLQGLWHWDQFTRQLAVTPTPTSRWGSPESYWTQSAEGSESDEILRKCLTQEEKRGCHPIQAGL